MINRTWRPLIDPILEDRPLALCDYQSTSQSDLIAADRFYGDRVGEVYYMHYNPRQRWHWLSEQTPEEVFVMKIYDSHPQKDESKCKSSWNASNFVVLFFKLIGFEFMKIAHMFPLRILLHRKAPKSGRVWRRGVL